MFSQSLKDLPTFTLGDGERLVQMNSPTVKTKLDVVQVLYRELCVKIRKVLIKCIIVAMASCTPTPLAFLA